MNIQFEQRVCACGCSRVFKVMVESKQTYASKECRYLKLEKGMIKEFLKREDFKVWDKKNNIQYVPPVSRKVL